MLAPSSSSTFESASAHVSTDLSALEKKETTKLWEEIEESSGSDQHVVYL